MVRLFTLIVISLWCSLSWAAPCHNTMGSPYIYNYNFGTKTITSPDENKAGQSYPDAFTWNLGEYYYAICDCPAGTAFGATYFTAKTDLPLGHFDGAQQYYKVNDNIEVATKIWIQGYLQKYVNVPFTSVSNEYWYDNWGCGDSNPYTSGSMGRLSLYIGKPFVGNVSFSKTVVAVYGNTVSGEAPGPQPMSVINITGNVVVPQNCVINAGQVVTVDFGNLLSTDFKTAGQKPNGFTDKTFNVPIQCTNIGASVNLTLSLQATPSAQNNQAIASSNTDVGVVVTNSEGAVIIPNDANSIIPFNTDVSGNASVTLKAYPVSTTGNAPAEGVFSALATLRVDFA